MTAGITRGVAPIADLLEQAKAGMIVLSGELASGEDWDSAQRLIELARAVDEVKHGISGLQGARIAAGGTVTARSAPAQRPKLPYYYVNDDALVKRGPSKKPPYHYEHRVPKADYDAVVSTVAELAATGREFDVDTLLEKCPLPNYQARIVVAVLAERKRLSQLRRGRYAFIDRRSVAEDGAAVWDSLPRQ